MFTYGGKQRSRTPSRLREPGFQGQSQDQPRCITFQLVAGDRFELPMHLAYETGVVTPLPALNLAYPHGLEPRTSGFGDQRSAN